MTLQIFAIIVAFTVLHDNSTIQRKLIILKRKKIVDTLPVLCYTYIANENQGCNKIIRSGRVVYR